MASRGRASRLPNKTRVKEYDPLTDPNLALHFANPIVRRQLEKTGIVDTSGRILNPTSYGAQSRVATATVGVRRTEAEEALLRREEADIRRRVQHLKLQQLENERRVQLVALMKEQERIRQEIVRLAKYLDEGPRSPLSPAGPEDMYGPGGKRFEFGGYDGDERATLHPHAAGGMPMQPMPVGEVRSPSYSYPGTLRSPSQNGSSSPGDHTGRSDSRTRLASAGDAPTSAGMTAPPPDPKFLTVQPGYFPFPQLQATGPPPVDASGRPLLAPHMIIHTPSGWIAQPIPASSLDDVTERTRNMLGHIMAAQSPGAAPSSAPAGPVTSPPPIHAMPMPVSDAAAVMRSPPAHSASSARGPSQLAAAGHSVLAHPSSAPSTTGLHRSHSYGHIPEGRGGASEGAADGRRPGGPPAQFHSTRELPRSHDRLGT